MQQIGRKKGTHTHTGTHVCMTVCLVQMSVSHTELDGPISVVCTQSTHTHIHPTDIQLHTYTTHSHPPTSTPPSHPIPHPPKSPALRPGEVVNCVHVSTSRVTHLRILLQVLLDELLGVRVDILPHILTCTKHRYI